jgi:hypothetical protein
MGARVNISAVKKHMSTLLKTSFAVLLVASSALSVKAQSTVAYQSDLYYYPGNIAATMKASSGVEYGDQVQLSGTATYVTGFSFDYYADNVTDGTAVVTFYKGNGNGDPTTVLWQSQAFDIVNTSTLPENSIGQVVAFTTTDLGGGFQGDISMTWSVKFTYATGDVQLFYSGLTPTTGGNYPDFWKKTGGTWEKILVAEAPEGAVNFASTITTTVPEPTTFALLGIGGLAGLFAVRRRK